MKLIAAIGLAVLLPMGESKAQSFRVGVGIQVGHSSPQVRAQHRSPRVSVRRPAVVTSPRIVKSVRRGHWVTKRTRHWIPAVYAYRRGIHGRRICILVRAGHYEYREHKVWVVAPRQKHRLHGHRTAQGRMRAHSQRAYPERRQAPRSRAKPQPRRAQPERSSPRRSTPRVTEPQKGRRTRVGVLYS